MFWWHQTTLLIPITDIYNVIIGTCLATQRNRAMQTFIYIVFYVGYPLKMCDPKSSMYLRLMSNPKYCTQCPDVWSAMPTELWLQRYLSCSQCATPNDGLQMTISALSVWPQMMCYDGHCPAISMWSQIMGYKGHHLDISVWPQIIYGICSQSITQNDLRYLLSACNPKWSKVPAQDM